MSSHGKARKLAWMLFALGLLTGFVVEDGDLSSIDTARRLQVTHSLWTSQPPVRNGDYPDFGVVSPDGAIHAWYGMGQSLVMLPADLASSLIVAETTPESTGLKGRIKQAFIVYATFPLLTAGCLVLGYALLLQLGLGLKASALGAMGMLFGTTLLQWTQVNQENSLTLLCFLGTLYACLRWLATGRLGYMVFAGFTAGFALLTRLPTVFETAAAGLVVLAFLFLPRVAEGAVVARARSQWLAAGAIFSAVLAVFVVAERFYQWCRFGSWSNTYIGIHERQDPSWYAGGDWWSGVWTLLFSPHDSVFWIDPGILLLALMLIFFFRKISMGIKALAFCLFMLLLVLVAFYAPYPWPGGASGWGSRYTTTPSIVLGLLGFGLLANLGRESCTSFKAAALIIVAYALLAQVGSLLYWSNLEQLQWAAWGGETFLVGQRWLNTVAFFGGTFGESSLMVPALSERIMRLNFMPFHVRAELGGPVGVAALALWLLLLAAIVAWVVAIWRVASKRDLSGEKHDCR
jgi:hypothetical protein